MSHIAYVAGPMSGYPDDNWPLFKRVTSWLREKQLFDKVICPTECSPTAKEQSYEVNLRLDLRHALEANCIVLLPDWRASKGACLEALILAATLGATAYEVWSSKDVLYMALLPANEVKYQVMTAYYSRVIVPTIQESLHA